MTDPRYLASHQIRDLLEQEQEHSYCNFFKVVLADLFREQLCDLTLEPHFAQQNTNDEIWSANKAYFNNGCVLFLAQLFKFQVFTQSDIISYCHFILAKVFKLMNFRYDAKLPKELVNQKDKKGAKITHMEQQLTKLNHLLKSLPKNFSSTQQGCSLYLYILLYSNSNAYFQTDLLKDELKFKFLIKFNDYLNTQSIKHILCWNHQLMMSTLLNTNTKETQLQNQEIQILIANQFNEQLSQQWTKGDISLIDIIVSNYQYEEQISWYDKANLDQLSFLNTVYDIFFFALEYGIMTIFYQQLLQVTQVLSLQTKMKLFNKLVNWIVDCYQDSLNAYQVELIYILTRLLFQRKVLLETILADSILCGNYLLPDHLFRSLINQCYNRDLQEMQGLSCDEKQQLNQLIYGYQYEKINKNNILVQYQISSKYSYFAETDNKLQLPNMFEFNTLDTLKSLIFGPNYSQLEDELKTKKLKTLQTLIIKSHDNIPQNEALALFFAEMSFSIGASIFYEVGISVSDFQKKNYFQILIALQRFVKTQNVEYLTLAQPLCTSFVFDFLWKSCLNDKSGNTFVKLITKLNNSLNQSRLIQLLKQTQLFNHSPDYFAVWEQFGISNQ